MLTINKIQIKELLGRGRGGRFSGWGFGDGRLVSTGHPLRGASGWGHRVRRGFARRWGEQSVCVMLLELIVRIAPLHATLVYLMSTFFSMASD